MLCYKLIGRFILRRKLVVGEWQDIEPSEILDA
jgi:hypothetical protein